MPTPLQISLKVTGLDQAKADLQTFAQGGKRSFEELAADARRLSADSATTNKALEGVAKRVKAMAADFDPAAAASLRLRNSLTDIDRALRANVVTQAQAAQLTARLRAEHDNLSGSNVRAAVSTSQLRFAVQNLGFQLNDIGTSLASGASPMQVLAQQSGQVVQAFQQGGGVSAVLGGFASGLRSLITPTTAAVAGVVALAAGFGVLLVRSSGNAEELRKFNLILQGTGRDSLTTAGNLQQVVRQMRDVGVSRDDANAAVSAIARNPRLNPAQAGRIADIGLAVGARLGLEKPAAGIEQFAAAATSAEAMLKLAFQIGAVGDATNQMTVAEATNIREMIRHGQEAEALRLAIAGVEKNVGGYKNTLGESKTAINDLKSAWREFIDAASDSTAMDNIRRLLTENLKDWADLLSGNVRSVLQRNGLSSAPSAGPTVDWRAERNAAIRQANPAAGGYIATGLTIGGALDLIEQFESGGRNVPNFKFGPGRTAQGFFQITNSTWRDIAGRAGIDLNQYPNAMSAPYGVQRGAASALFAERGFAPWAPYNAPLRQAIDRVSRGAAGNLGISRDLGASSDLTLPDPDKTSRAAVAIKTLTEAEAKRTDIAKLWGVEQQVANAREQEYQRALTETGDRTTAAELAEIAATGARERANIELQKAATVQDMQTAAVLKTAEAFKVSEAAGYRVAAEQQARIEVMQRAGDVTVRTRQILEEGAASAIRSGQQQLAAAQPQLAALEKLAEATAKGSDAAREQEIRNQAALATQDALARAEATRNPVLIAQAKALTAAAEAEERRRRAAASAIQFNSVANDNLRTVGLIDLETGLQGLPQGEIARRLGNAKALLDLEKEQVPLTSEVARNYLRSVDAIGEARNRLIDAQRETQRWEDAARSVANTIENALTRSIEDAFSGNKVEDWGKRIKSMLSSLVSQISSSLFIRPALGSVFGALGLGGLAQQYGTFGGTAGGSGGGGQGFNLGTISNGASLLNSVSGGGLFGGTGSFLNGIGQNLGFWGGTPYAANGLFGATTLGGFLGGAGAGFGAGSLLNSLIGGNQLGGTVGSGFGSLAGAAIGSIVPGIGTLIGGLIGGAGGGMFGGMFGNNRPSNFSTGVGIDLATGAQSDFRSAGNAQNDQQARQISDAISTFARNLQRTTGGTLSGSINPDVGSRDGIQLNYDIAGYGSGTYKASDAQDAIRVAQLAVARGLSGVTDTIRTVIDAVSDPADLDAAIQFAATYDKIAEAARDAFSSIPSDLEQTGPFAQAKQQIAATFAEITTNAQKFGLALDPVNAALDEASRRLTEDFNRSIADAITAIENPLQAMVETEKRAGAARVREAEAVAGNMEQVNRLNALTLDQIWKNQTASLRSLVDDMRTGSLSGLTPAASVAAANDNFRGLLALAQGGNLSRIGDLESAGRSLIGQAQSAYGNAPLTASMRGSILSGIDQVLASRSFAGGTDFTPPGAILVGERGPEVLYQPGGLGIAPNGRTGPSGGDLVGEIRALRDMLAAVLQAGNRIAVSVGAETVKRLDARIAMESRPPIVEPARRKIA